MTFIQTLKNSFERSSVVRGPASGLHHYSSENEFEKSRIHLRVDPDGTGVLIVNANRIMHLNPTAALMAYFILEGNTDKQITRAISKQYKANIREVESDLSAFHHQIEEVVRPDGACPVHELKLESIMPFSARPSAPYRMDLALTYRCNNDCAHCYNARERNFPELSTDQWKNILDELLALGIPHIVFTGGEATLRNDLPELIAHAENNGQITGLNTNARRLSSCAPSFLAGIMSLRDMPSHMTIGLATSTEE